MAPLSSTVPSWWNKESEKKNALRVSFEKRKKEKKTIVQPSIQSGNEERELGGVSIEIFPLETLLSSMREIKHSNGSLSNSI